MQSLQDWQQQVGRDVAVLKTSAQAAEEGVREARTTLRTETQNALATIRTEVEHGVIQARAVGRHEIDAVRADCEALVQRVRKQGQARQAVALLVALLALLVAAGAVALPLLHH